MPWGAATSQQGMELKKSIFDRLKRLAAVEGVTTIGGAKFVVTSKNVDDLTNLKFNFQTAQDSQAHIPTRVQWDFAFKLFNEWRDENGFGGIHSISWFRESLFSGVFLNATKYPAYFDMAIKKAKIERNVGLPVDVRGQLVIIGTAGSNSVKDAMKEVDDLLQRDAGEVVVTNRRSEALVTLDKMLDDKIPAALVGAEIEPTPFNVHRLTSLMAAEVKLGIPDANEVHRVLGVAIRKLKAAMRVEARKQAKMRKSIDAKIAEVEKARSVEQPTVTPLATMGRDV